MRDAGSAADALKAGYQVACLTASGLAALTCVSPAVAVAQDEEIAADAAADPEPEGKSYLTVAIGCTGGKHRSVSIAIALAERLGLGDELRVVHRDARAGGGSAGGAT